MFWRFKNATQEKIVKKNKKYEIFQGVTFCFSWLQNSEFYIFYSGIWSAYPKLAIQSRGRNSTIYQDAPAGGPDAPSDQNFRVRIIRGSKNSFSIFLMNFTILCRTVLLQIGTTVVMRAKKRFRMGPEIVFSC